MATKTTKSPKKSPKTTPKKVGTKSTNKKTTKKEVKKNTTKSPKKIIKKKATKLTKKAPKQLKKYSGSKYKINKEQLNKIIKDLIKKGENKRFVTYEEVLSYIPYPEHNLKAIEEIYETLNRSQIDVVNNISLLENSEELSKEEILKDSSLES